MSPIRLVGGEVGTPEFQKLFNALASKIDAVNGDIGLTVTAIPQTAGSSGAAVTAAVAGTVKKKVTLVFTETASGDVAEWVDGISPVTITPTEVVVDVQVGVPTADDTTPLFTRGRATVTLTYDTDAGATKTYAAGDTVGFTSSCAAVAGITVTETAADFLDTFVA